MNDVSQERGLKDDFRHKIHLASAAQFDQLLQRQASLEEEGGDSQPFMGDISAAAMKKLIVKEARLRLEDALNSYIAAKPEEGTRQVVKDKILECADTEDSRDQALELQGLNLTELPALDGCGIHRLLSPVKYLYLSDNHLTNLPDWIGTMTQLKVLACAHNELEVFPECIFALKALESLDLRSNMIQRLPGYVRWFLSSIQFWNVQHR